MLPRSSRPTLIVALALTVGLGACASSGSSGPRRSSTRITAEEFEDFSQQDVFSIVQRLRPQWLVVRAPASTQGRAQISVIIDGVKQTGSVEVLRSIRGSDVDELRYINARDATTRYGTDNVAGAIEVITKH